MSDEEKDSDKSSGKKDKKDKKRKPRGPKRQEKRFIATSPFNATLVKVVGALGGLTLGGGSYAYFLSSFGKEAAKFRDAAKEAAKVGLASTEAMPADLARLEHLPEYLIAAGAIITGIAIWIGTASEPPIRVGDPGIAMERGEVRRMPWWAVSQITFESGNLALVIAGKDESGTTWTFKVPLKSHPEAVGWIVKEALDRIPKVVEIKDDVLEKLPGANPHAGLKVDLEPLQVVGKKDALSGKLISYEPDARVCDRCERVYFKRSVPKKCKCGASLLHLRSALGQEEDETNDEDEDDDKDIRDRNRRELEGSSS